MNTIISVNDILNSGLRISSDINDQVIKFCIETVERCYVVDEFPMYQEVLTNPSQHQDILNGTDEHPSLKSAICLQVHAYLLYDTFCSTRFGTVEKYADESSNPKLEAIKQLSMVKWEAGMIMIRKINKYYNLDTRGLTHNSCLFSELWA